MKHKVWVNKNAIREGSPGIIHAYTGDDGVTHIRRTVRLDLPEGAAVVQDPAGEGNVVAWVEWDD